MARTLNLKEACERYGLNYRRAWYALTAGRVKAKVVGRTWSLTPAHAELLRRFLEGKPRTTL